jgi:hypothetical protein
MGNLGDGLFSGVRLKRDRAFKLLDALKADCDEWTGTVKVDLSHSIEDGGWNVWSAGPLPSPPAEFGIRVGEIAYQLRSALDHAAHAIVLANGGKPTRSTYFPVSLTEQSWKSQSKPYLKGASEDSIEVVRVWQPCYQQPEVPQMDQLAAINEIALVDKHRTLLPVVAGLGLHKLHVTGKSSYSTWRTVQAVGRGEDETVLLDERAWVFKALVSHADTPEVPDLSLKLQLDGASQVAPSVRFTTHFPYEVRFGVENLRTMAKHVRRVLLHVENSV